MDAAHDTRRQLGQLMVEEGFLTEEQLKHALAEQSRRGEPLGKILVDLEYVSPGAVANALAEQHGGLLKTEFGTSAGLRAVPTEARPFNPKIPKPGAEPVRVSIEEFDAVRAEAAQQTARAINLEAQLQATLAERNRVSQTLHELQTQGVPSGADDARVAELEAKVQEEIAKRETLHRVASARLAELEAQLQEGGAPAVEDPAKAERIAALESELHAARNERNALSQSLNELQVRLGEAAKTHQDELARATAGADARVAVLESQLASEGVEDPRIAELEAQALAAAEEREQLAARAAELDAQLARLVEELADRDRRLEEAAEEHRQELERATTAADARVAAVEKQLESTLASAPDDSRISELEAEVESAAKEQDELRARAAELETRLTARVDELAERDARLGESANELARLKREHRAAVSELERQLQEAVAAQPEPEPEPEPEPAELSHRVFVPSTSGYALVERAGPAPESGTTIELDDVRFVVRRIGRSPLPGRTGRCVFVEAV